MSQQYKIFVLVMLALIIIPENQAQINPVYKIMIERGWTPFSNNDNIQLTPQQVTNEFIKSMGYNDTIVSNLQKNGVDLVHLYKMPPPFNLKTLTAISDCIIIGTVFKKDYPLVENAYFNTIAYVQVEEFLRNDYNLHENQISVMIASGPTPSEGRRIEVGEDTLAIGEHVMLFLSANTLIEMANYNKLSRLYNNLINDPIIRFRIKAKYSIKSGKVFDNHFLDNVVNVKNDISSVLEVIH